MESMFVGLRTNRGLRFASTAVLGAAAVGVLAGGGAIVVTSAATSQRVEQTQRLATQGEVDAPDALRDSDRRQPGQVVGAVDRTVPPVQPGRPDPTPGRSADQGSPDTPPVDRGTDVADQIHLALSGNDLRPGDDGFGQAVAERARAGGLGGDVSAVTRRDAGSAADDGSVPETASPDPRPSAGQPTPQGPPATTPPDTAPKGPPPDKGKPATVGGSRP